MNNQLIKDMICAIAVDRVSEASPAFNTLMAQKMMAAVESKHQQVAANIFNGSNGNRK